jgi:hypothetical protein
LERRTTAVPSQQTERISAVEVDHSCPSPTFVGCHCTTGTPPPGLRTVTNLRATPGIPSTQSCPVRDTFVRCHCTTGTPPPSIRTVANLRATPGIAGTQSCPVRDTFVGCHRITGTPPPGLRTVTNLRVGGISPCWPTFACTMRWTCGLNA